MPIKNPQYYVNAILKIKTLNGYGKYWAIDDSCDGWSIVNIASPQIPTTILPYIEGDDTLNVFPLSSNVSKVGHYALGQFPNIEDIYLFKNDGIVVLYADSVGNLSSLANIYVPTDLLSTYESTYTYASYPLYWTDSTHSKFKTIRSDYDWTIPFITGQTTLTIQIMTDSVGMLSNGQKNAITLINIPNGYTSFEFGATEKLFDNTFPNLTTIDCQNEILFLGQAKEITQTGAILEVR